MTKAEEILIKGLNTKPPKASIYTTGVYLSPIKCEDGLWRWGVTEFEEDTYVCAIELDDNSINHPKTEGQSPADLIEISNDE